MKDRIALQLLALADEGDSCYDDLQNLQNKADGLFLLFKSLMFDRASDLHALVHFLMHNPASPWREPGLQWQEVGRRKPERGTVITNLALAAALQRKVVFTKKELLEFGVSNLSFDCYIKVGNNYFKPSAFDKHIEEISARAIRICNQVRGECVEKVDILLSKLYDLASIFMNVGHEDGPRKYCQMLIEKGDTLSTTQEDTLLAVAPYDQALNILGCDETKKILGGRQAIQEATLLHRKGALLKQAGYHDQALKCLAKAMRLTEMAIGSKGDPHNVILIVTILREMGAIMIKHEAEKFLEAQRSFHHIYMASSLLEEALIRYVTIPDLKCPPDASLLVLLRLVCNQPGTNTPQSLSRNFPYRIFRIFSLSQVSKTPIMFDEPSALSDVLHSLASAAFGNRASPSIAEWSARAVTEILSRNHKQTIVPDDSISMIEAMNVLVKLMETHLANPAVIGEVCRALLSILHSNQAPASLGDRVESACIDALDVHKHNFNVISPALKVLHWLEREAQVRGVEQDTASRVNECAQQLAYDHQFYFVRQLLKSLDAVCHDPAHCSLALTVLEIMETLVNDHITGDVHQRALVSCEGRHLIREAMEAQPDDELIQKCGNRVLDKCKAQVQGTEMCEWAQAQIEVLMLRVGKVDGFIKVRLVYRC